MDSSTFQFAPRPSGALHETWLSLRSLPLEALKLENLDARSVYYCGDPCQLPHAPSLRAAWLQVHLEASPPRSPSPFSALLSRPHGVGLVPLASLGGSGGLQQWRCADLDFQGSASEDSHGFEAL